MMTTTPGAKAQLVGKGRKPRRNRRRGFVLLAGSLLGAGSLTWQVPLAVAAAPLVVPGELDAVTTLSATNAWAVGLTQHSTVLIEHWDGSAWTTVAAPSPGYVNALAGVSATAANDVWAVGSQFFTGKTQYYNTLIEHYDGAKWSVIPSPNYGFSDQLTGVKAFSANDVWAAGWAENGSGGDVTLIEHYDGVAWSIVASPNPTTTVMSADAVSAAAGGAPPSGPPAGPGAPLGAPATGAARSGSGYLVDTLGGIWGSGPNDVWAVGSYYPKTNNSYEAALILHWNGRDWQQVPSPAMPKGGVESYLDGVAGYSSGDVTAVGAVYTNVWKSLVEHWDGSSWKVVASQDPAASRDTQLSSASAIGSQGTWVAGIDQTAVDAVTGRLGNRGGRLTLVNNEGANSIKGISADGANDAWGVGLAVYGSYVYIVIDHWNGSSWTELTALP